MTTTSPYTNHQIEKLGNAIIYLANHLPSKLYKTNLLKFLYIIEESSIKKYGIPFFGIDFKIWKLGPVNADIYYELTEELSYFKEYINITSTEFGKFVHAKADFSDDEFSDNDVELMDDIINTFKNYTSDELVKYTHLETKPWYQQSNDLGLLDSSGNLLRSITDVSIDFTTILDESTFQHFVYQSSMESKQIFESLM